MIPDSIGQALNALREHLEERGFTLQKPRNTIPTSRVEKLTQRLARLSRTSNFDLVVVDFNLGT